MCRYLRKRSARRRNRNRDPDAGGARRARAARPGGASHRAEDRVRHRSDRGRQHRRRPRRRFPDQRRAPRAQRSHLTRGAWRPAAFITFKPKDASAANELANPYQDLYFLLTVPHFLHGSACGWSCDRRTRTRRRSCTTASATRPWRRPTITEATSTAARIRRCPPDCAGTSWATSSSSSAPLTPRTGSSSTRRAGSPPI